MKIKLLLAGAAMLTLTAAAPTPYGYALFPGADPDMNVYGDRYWAYVTDGPVYSSGDGRNWTREADRLVTLANVPWVDDDGAPAHYLWAPDMVILNGKYHYYYSVGPQSPGRPSRIGLAVCDTPKGPCQDSGSPVLTGDSTFEAIDPMVFKDLDNNRVLMYAGGSAGANGSRLRLYAVDQQTGRLGSRYVAPNSNQIYQPFNFTEGAFMHKRNGTYYLSYSVGSWERSDYRVRYVRSSSPFGPWQDLDPPESALIVQSQGTTKGPGHHSMLTSLGNPNQWLIAYHRWENRTGDGPYAGDGIGPRQTALGRINYNADGTIQPVNLDAH